MKISDKIIFDKKINTFKNETIKQFFLEFFLVKNLMIRVISFLVISVVCGLAFFLLRHYSLADSWPGLYFNKGFAYGIGNDWEPWVNYLLKIIPIIILFVIMLVTNEWYLYLPISIVFINSVFNVIDKSIIDVYKGVIYIDTVVDNIRWESFGFTNNIADIFIIFGAVLTFVAFIWEVNRLHKLRKNKNDEEQDNCPAI